MRVKGIPPQEDDSQFIDMDRITTAQKREVYTLPDEPLIAGVDLAWGGPDKNVVRFRCGHDARSIPAVRIPGERTRDGSVMVVKLADLLKQTFNGRKIHTMFIDSAGVSGTVGTRLRLLGHQNVIEVNFGADSPDPHYRFMRDYIWGKMKEWLLVGAIDSDSQLEADLSGPGYTLDNRIRIKLESKDDMKKRGLDSPDDGDALALTFAQTVAVPEPEQKAYDERPFGYSRPRGSVAILLVSSIFLRRDSGRCKQRVWHGGSPWDFGGRLSR